MLSTDDKTYRIAIDAMGGDFAPINEINGAIRVFEKKKSDLNLEIIFVGNKNKIQEALDQFDISKLKYSIVNADDVVLMDDDPTASVKQKQNSSLYKGIEFHSKGHADAFISAGNTGAVLSTATIILGRIPGVSRPTIGQFFPTPHQSPAFVVDIGANIDCKPRFLYEFAVMGSIFVTNILGLEHPRVALLNIGEESSKGTEIIQQTFKLLSESQLNFIGNVEGLDILQGSADVIVCDGFTGNIVLKFAESVLHFLKIKIKNVAHKDILSGITVSLISPFLKRLFKDFDYQEYGGVPLLGVNGVVIIGHGKSSPIAFQNMILKAVEVVRCDINSKIKSALKPISILENTNK